MLTQQYPAHQWIFLFLTNHCRCFKKTSLIGYKYKTEIYNHQVPEKPNIEFKAFNLLGRQATEVGRYKTRELRTMTLAILLISSGLILEVTCSKGEISAFFFSEDKYSSNSGARFACIYQIYIYFCCFLFPQGSNLEYRKFIYKGC